MEQPIVDPEDQLFEERKRAISNVAAEKLQNIKLKGKKVIQKEITELLNASFALGYIKGQSDLKKSLQENKENEQATSDSGSEQSQVSNGQDSQLVHHETPA